MAATRKEQTSKLAIVVLTGQDARGLVTKATRTIGNIHPDLSDDDLYEIGAELAQFPTYEIRSIGRIDRALLQPRITERHTHKGRG